MNKKLIAVALAALPVAAMADVTLYGSLNAGLEHDTATNSASNNGVHDYTSIIGFKGTEDLGNGLKTVWQVENRVVIGGNSNTYSGSANQLASRQSFVGLDGGNLGMVRIGLINSSLKDLYNVDQWQYDGEMAGYKTEGNSGVNGLSVMTNQSNRLKNAIRYDSATFYGFNANAVYSFGENKSQTNNVTQSSDIATVGLNYSISDFGFHYAYQKEFNPNAIENSSTAVAQTGSSVSTAHINFFEADYNANNLFVGLAYQDMVGYNWNDGYGSVVAAQEGLKSREAALSVAYTIGAFTPKFTYAKGWDQQQGGSSLSNTGYQQYVVGVDYALSKRTTAEFAYGRLKADSASSLAVNGADTTYSTLALSMMHNF